MVRYSPIIVAVLLIVGLTLGNEQLSLTAVLPRDRHQRAFHLTIRCRDGLGVCARHPVLLLDLLGIHGLNVA